jgi:medium-chain acyl-[acyl-carrier-protein] hydrolase
VTERAELAQWFATPFRNPAARLRLFCFPHAGGAASAYLQWARPLDRHAIEMWAVQPPGRENRIAEPACADVRALADALAAVMPPLLDRPYACFGHSMGAFVAYELVHRLSHRGHALPLQMFVSGAPAPHVRRTARLSAIEDDDAFLRAIAKHLCGIPAVIWTSAELRSLVVPVLRADMRAAESYVCDDAPLPVALAAYGGDTDAWVSNDDIVRWRG